MVVVAEIGGGNNFKGGQNDSSGWCLIFQAANERHCRPWESVKVDHTNEAVALQQKSALPRMYVG